MAPGSPVLLRRFQPPWPPRPKRRARSPREYRAAIRQRGRCWRWRVGSCSSAFSSVRFMEVALGGELVFRRHLIKKREHQGDATISHKNHIYALDRLLAQSSIAPSQAPAFVKQIDRPKLTENVARESLMQCRDHTIEFIAPVALASMIDEYTIFGPKLGDRLPSFLGVSLSEHLVEIAFNEGLYCIRHSSLPYFR